MAISVVDIGTSSIKTLITNIEDSKEPNVVGFSNVPNTGMRKGGIVDIDATISAIKQSVTEAELMSGIKANHLYASIGGENVTGITGKGIVTISSSNCTAASVVTGIGSSGLGFGLSFLLAVMRQARPGKMSVEVTSKIKYFCRLLNINTPNNKSLRLGITHRIVINFRVHTVENFIIA